MSLWYQCRMAPEFASNGSVEYVLVVSRDISEQRNAEIALRESEKRAAIAALVASLAHEIHNPLSAAVNATYLLRHNSSLDSAAKQLVTLLATELSRVSAISKKLLTIDEQNAAAADD